MRYRRDHTDNSTYFFTVVTFGRKPVLWQQKNIDLLRAVFFEEMKRRPFIIDAIVVMPDHIHALWTLPANDNDYSTRWRNIKSLFTRKIKQDDRPEASPARRHKKEQAIWQRRFWEHRIRNEKDFENHVNYIHYNPVKHGYVQNPKDWRYSSVHRYIKRGIIDANWGSGKSTADSLKNIGNE